MMYDFNKIKEIVFKYTISDTLYKKQKNTSTYYVLYMMTQYYV